MRLQSCPQVLHVRAATTARQRVILLDTQPRNFLAELLRTGGFSKRTKTMFLFFLFTFAVPLLVPIVEFAHTVMVKYANARSHARSHART